MTLPSDPDAAIATVAARVEGAPAVALRYGRPATPEDSAGVDAGGDEQFAGDDLGPSDVGTTRRC